MELEKCIMTTDFEHCFLCGKPMDQIHHVMGGSKPMRKKSEKYGLFVPLCYICHGRVHDTASPDYYTLKKIAQADFMMHYSYGRWMNEFGKNYM